MVMHNKNTSARAHQYVQSLSPIIQSDTRKMTFLGRHADHPPDFKSPAGTLVDGIQCSCSGQPTGYGKKISSSQAQLGQATCLAVA